MKTRALPVVVIGAGPVGLAAAAHLASRKLSFSLLERSNAVAQSIRDWEHVRLFTPWRFDVDTAARRALEARGSWTMPDEDHLPTGAELLERYLDPLAQLPEIQERLSLDHEVIAISRLGLDKGGSKGRDDEPFVVRTKRSSGAVRDVHARAVIDTTGVWAQPNPMGANGLRAIGEEEAADHLHYGIPDILGRERERYADKRVAVIGSGHSAANSLLALAELARTHPKTRIHWLLRSNNTSRLFSDGADDALPARGQLGTQLQAMVTSGQLSMLTEFSIARAQVGPTGLVLQDTNRRGELLCVTVDRAIVATGQRPNLEMLRELRLDIDPTTEAVSTLAPLIDPSQHSCGTVPPHGVRELTHPEPGFYIAGNKSYGRAPTFLLATGYEQVRSIVAAIAGDLTAAHAVQLNLPAAGVCGTGQTDSSGAHAQCCVPDTPAPAPVAIRCC